MHHSHLTRLPIEGPKTIRTDGFSKGKHSISSYSKYILYTYISIVHVYATRTYIVYYVYALYYYYNRNAVAILYQSKGLLLCFLLLLFLFL